MVTEVDEGKGLVKVYWENIRNRVAKVEPDFTKIVDELAPDKAFPLYLAYYPYGMLIADTKSPFIPRIKKGCYRLSNSDPELPKDISKHLSYGSDSLPLGMVLEKELEYFIDLEDEQITLPWAIYSPGSFFPFAKVLSKKCDRIYAPNGVLTATSGARSVFMLPNIGCLTNHVNLQRDFNIQLPPPKSLYDQWYLFKEIVNSEVIDCHWRSCLVYFSEKWVSKLHNDKAWLKLKLYLHEIGWHAFEFERNYIYYNIIFSVIQKKCNLKPNPYLTDTAKHLFTTALGAAPGYAPAHTDDFLPLEYLQKPYIESYGMKKYYPTIMQPKVYNFETDITPIYYSLQNPSTFEFSPKARKLSSTLFEMRELEYIMRIFLKELIKNNTIGSDTVISEVAKKVQFKYFHNEFDRHRVITSSDKIPLLDKRFNYLSTSTKMPDAKFASDARFVRGCISIGINHKE